MCVVLMLVLQLSVSNYHNLTTPKFLFLEHIVDISHKPTQYFFAINQSVNKS